MENKALVTEITGNYGSNVVGILKKHKSYKLTFKVKGDFRLQFFLTEEDTGKHLFVINRCALVTTGSYTYTFRAPEDALLEYNMRHDGTASEIVLIEIE